jgi:hypothetical protein
MVSFSSIASLLTEKPQKKTLISYLQQTHCLKANG